jgi:hypothetical protein
MALMIHCGGRHVEKHELKAMVPPPATQSYKPVPFIDIVDLLEERVVREFRGIPHTLSLGVNKANTQLFGAISIESRGPLEKRTPNVGFRSSYDKSIAPALCGGARITVCDNMMFSGDFFKVVRKQTGDCMEDLVLLIMGAVAKLESEFHHVDVMAATFEDIEVRTIEGFRQLGELMGRGVLNQQQTGSAMRAWKNPLHEEFEPRTAWSLYNAVTEGLKNGSPAHLLRQYMTVHDHMAQHYLTQEQRFLAAPTVN